MYREWKQRSSVRYKRHELAQMSQGVTEGCKTGGSFEAGTEIFSPAPLSDWLWAQKSSYPYGIRTIFPEYQAAWEWICTFTSHIRPHVLTLSWAGGNFTFIFTVTHLVSMLHYRLPLESRLRGSRSLPGFEPWSLVRCQYFAVFHPSLTPQDEVSENASSNVTCENNLCLLTSQFWKPVRQLKAF